MNIILIRINFKLCLIAFLTVFLCSCIHAKPNKATYNDTELSNSLMSNSSLIKLEKDTKINKSKINEKQTILSKNAIVKKQNKPVKEITILGKKRRLSILNLSKSGLKDFMKEYAANKLIKAKDILDNIILTLKDDKHNQTNVLNELNTIKPEEMAGFNLIDIYKELSNYSNSQKSVTKVEADSNANLINTNSKDNLNTDQKSVPKIKADSVKTDSNTNIINIDTKDNLYIKIKFYEIYKSLELPESTKPAGAFVDKTKYFINDFLSNTKKRAWLIRTLKRMYKYKPIVENVFNNWDFPDIFKYIPIIESSYRPNAVSSTNAVGMWQFMRKTAKYYGLIVTKGYDERKDVKMATRTAAIHLNHLILRFGRGHGFLIAMASYNAGEGKVSRAIYKLKDHTKRTFWNLVEHGYLDSRRVNETNNYVPQIIATYIIATNPKRFGINIEEEFIKNIQTSSMITLEKPIKIKSIAKSCELDESIIREINPDISPNNTTTPGLRVPFYFSLPKSCNKNKLNIFLASKGLTNLNKQKSRKLKKEKFNGMLVKHMVLKGHSLTKIGKWYKVSPALIKRWNPHIKRNKLIRGQLVRLHIPKEDIKKIKHRVKKNENLYSIAGKYNVSIDLLKGANSLVDSTIYENQWLNVYIPRKTSKTKTAVRKTKTKSVAKKTVKPTKKANYSKKTITKKIIDKKLANSENKKAEKKPGIFILNYKVKKGNTLLELADIFNTTVQDIIEDNPFLQYSKLQIGMHIKIKLNKPFNTIKYKVKNGDTLDKIANQFKIESKTIMSFNGMLNKTVKLDQYLYIFKYE